MITYILGVITGIIISGVFCAVIVVIHLGDQLRNYDQEYKKKYGIKEDVEDLM